MSVWKMAMVTAASALVLAACGGSSDNGSSTSCSAHGGTTSGTGTATVKVVSDPNTIGKYDPSTVTIKAGDSVLWDFQDSAAPHTVTAEDSSFDSCTQNAGAKFVVTFSKAGEFKYHCTIHAQMVGDVKVS